MIFWCIIYLLCLLAAGYGAAAIARSGGRRMERFGLAACLGQAIFGFILIAISMCGRPPNRTTIFCIAAVIGSAAIVRRPRESSVPKPRESGFAIAWTVICLIAIAYGICVVAQDAFFLPAIERDAYSIWQLKAKVLAIYALEPRPSYFMDLALSYSHLRYPPLVPMISAGVHAMTGTLDDEFGKSPPLLLYLGLGAAIFSVIRASRGQIAAITATALLLTTPTILATAACGTADMTLAAFYGCSILYLLRWQERQHTRDLILCLIFTAAMAWTKNEGLVLALINAAAVAALRPRDWSAKQIGIRVGFFVAVGLLFAHWLIYSHDLPSTDENYPAHMNVHELAAHISRFPVIISSMSADLINWHHWGLFWITLAIVAIFQWRRNLHQPIAMLWILLIVHLLAYIPFYMVTPWQLPQLMPYSQGRLLLHATPAAALLIGLLWPRGMAESKNFD
jgi:4-amino-4-deoxy-L-arabinose transferase-like glycosyltransferase